MEFIRKTISQLEQKKYSFGLYFGLFISAVFLRTFLEVVLGVGKMTTAIALMLHYPMFYLSLLLMLLLILKLFSAENIEKIFKVLVPAFCIIILPPLVDLLVLGSGGFHPKYLFFPDANIKNVAKMFLTFFGQSSLKTGITLGMRIEITLGIIGVGIYTYIKSRNPLRAILSGIITYIVIFVYVSQPVMLKAFEQFPQILGFVRQGNISWTQFYMIIITVQFPFVMLAWGKEKFAGVIGNLRPFRVFHFLLMLFFGFWLGVSGKMELFGEINFYDSIFAAMAFFFAWEFSVITNDLVDVDIDRVSNRKRPLANGNLEKNQMFWLATFYLLFAILSASLIGGRFAFIVMSFIAVYWLYSMPPARLKRIPIFSVAIVSFASLMPIFGGAIIAGRHPIAIPQKVIWTIFIVFALSFNAKDLKDYEGDKSAGIRTLMTIFGERNGRILIGVLDWASYCLFLMILGLWNSSVLLLSALFGGLTFLIVIKNRTEKAISTEKIIFILYFIYFAVLTIFFRQILVNAIFG
ncbi:UbiA prenyltransferase family protein [bacterium]|nr:UbiA prenyltransferase family protein [bacterium]